MPPRKDDESSSSSSDDETRRKKKKKKESKKKKKAEKKKRLHEVVGYTNESNPFGDADLGRKFVWRKKEEAASTTKKRRSDEEYLEEIEKVRERRAARERDLAERERLREEEFRRKELEKHADVDKSFDAFAVRQIKVRSKVRLTEDRPTPIDLLAQNLLLLEPEEFQEFRGEPSTKNVPIQRLPPSQILSAASHTELLEVRDGAKAYLELDGGAFWPEVVVACRARLQPTSTRKGGGIHPDVVETIEADFKGKSVADLEKIDIRTQRRPDDTPEDVKYWDHVEILTRRALADARLDAIHASTVAQCELKFPEKRVNPTASPKASRGGQVVGGKETTQQQKKEKSDTWTADARAEDMVRREEARGMEDDEELFATEVPTTTTTTTTSKKSHQRRTTKPKYLNKIKTGYEWNKYNQAHYTTDEPPPKTVQGYKFNIFYPDLADPSTPPTYVLERCPSSSEDFDDTLEGSPNDFVIIRFKAGPPYEDLAFRIVNQEWDLAAKKGFRCVFERGILQLFFNFKRWRYRR